MGTSDAIRGMPDLETSPTFVAGRLGVRPRFKNVVVEGERQKAKRPKLTAHNRARTLSRALDIAQIGDVSEAGLGFVSDPKFQVTDEVDITLPFVDRQVPVLVVTKAKINWPLGIRKSMLVGR